MVRKKRILVYICLLGVGLLSFIFSSCGDNPVVVKTEPPYQFDSARYNWKIDTVPEFILDICGNDTSNIYFLGALDMLKYDGNTYQVIWFPYHFLPTSFGETNMGNVYVAGGFHDSTSGSNGFIKYDGATFYQISIPDSLQRFYLKGVYAVSDNEIWIGTNKGRLLEFDGTGFQYYLYDTNYYVYPESKTTADDLLVLAYSYTNVTNVYQILNFTNGTWNLLYSTDGFPYLGPFRVNNELIASNESGFYKFIGNDFAKIFNIPNFLPLYFDGSSEQDMLCFGEIHELSQRSIFHWNGDKWSKEMTYNYSLMPMWIRKIQNIYVAVWDTQNLRRIICYGTPKSK